MWKEEKNLVLLMLWFCIYSEHTQAVEYTVFIPQFQEAARSKSDVLPSLSFRLKLPHFKSDM